MSRVCLISKSIHLALTLLILYSPSLSANETWEGQGLVLLLRHALAPGMGDPSNFRLDDCSTQRNLSDAGRQQAREIGNALRAQGVKSAKVYTSQWCRCLETAELLGFGEITELPVLNSFFQRRQDREPNLRGLREFLADKAGSHELIILVTHQVTVTAMTNVFPASGAGVLLQLDEDGAYSIIKEVSW